MYGRSLPLSNNFGPMAVSTVEALHSLGVCCGEDSLRSPQQVTVDELEKADRIVALKQEEHLPLLQERFPAWAEKVEYWHIEDAPGVLHLIEREFQELILLLKVMGNG